ncbi:MAG: hypothetical protein R3E83_09250 [Burkholderiaceae bacterium]
MKAIPEPFEELLCDGGLAAPDHGFAGRVLARIEATALAGQGARADGAATRPVIVSSPIGRWRALALAAAAIYGVLQSLSFALGAWIAVGAQ